MPFYQVHHSCALTQGQRQNLATAITKLHCNAFKTPAFLVHVRFLAEDNTDNTYFVAGKPHPLTSNRISGNVRTSAARSKADFDELGAKIEAVWYETLQVTSPAEKSTWSGEDEKTRLIMVKFIPLVAIREGGMAAPQAGEEEAWLKEQLPHIESMANKGIEDFMGFWNEIKGNKGPISDLLYRKASNAEELQYGISAGRWLTEVAHPESVTYYVKANSPRAAKPTDKSGPPPPPERRQSSCDTLKSIVDDPKLFEAAIQALRQHRAKTKDSLSSNLKPQDSRDIDATYILTWWNQTGGDLLTLYDAQVHPSWILSVKAMPDKHFRTGSTILAWFFTNGAWAQGVMDGYCIWYAPNGSWFGVNIHCPVQFLGIGTAPYYEVAWSEWGKETFFKPVDEPFMSFDFPRSLGYDIQIKPQSRHSSIIVDVIVSKIP